MALRASLLVVCLALGLVVSHEHGDSSSAAGPSESHQILADDLNEREARLDAPPTQTELMRAKSKRVAGFAPAELREDGLDGAITAEESDALEAAGALRGEEGAEAEVFLGESEDVDRIVSGKTCVGSKCHTDTMHDSSMLHAEVAKSHYDDHTLEDALDESPELGESMGLGNSSAGNSSASSASGSSGSSSCCACPAGAGGGGSNSTAGGNSSSASNSSGGRRLLSEDIESADGSNEAFFEDDELGEGNSSGNSSSASSSTASTACCACHKATQVTFTLSSLPPANPADAATFYKDLQGEIKTALGIPSSQVKFPEFKAAPAAAPAANTSELGEGMKVPVSVPGMKITLNLEPGPANANTTVMANTLAAAMSNPTSPLSSGKIMAQLDKSKGMSMGSVDANSDCSNIAKMWDYKDAPSPGGPAMWKKTYPKCGQPKQSPIRLPVTPPKSAKTVLRRLDFDYKLDKATLMNDGRAMMAMVPPGSNFRVSGEDGSDATLQYAVMHSPSEHVFTDDQGNDIRYAAELQLHHRTAKGLIKVVSILFSINAPNPFMDDLLGKIPAKCASASTDKTIKFEDALPFSRSYYMYYGTLTSPPCTESVTWYIMREQGTMSLEQLQKFRKAFNLDVKKPPGLKKEKMGVHDIQVIDKNKYPDYQFSEALMGDVRPLQPMDNRKLWTTPNGM